MHKCKYCEFIDVKHKYQACDDCLSEIKEYKISEDILELISYSIDEVLCVICLDDIELGNHIIRCQICMNRFHERCINKWHKSNLRCPVCRKNM